MKNTIHVAALGECMIELNGDPFGNINQRWGGDTLNTAVYLSRMAKQLDEPISAHFVTAVGDDPLSHSLTAQWREENVQTDFVLYDTQRLPGMYQILVDDNGERRFLYWRDQSAAKYIFQHPQFSSIHADLTNMDLLFLSGISLAILPEHDLTLLHQSIDNCRRIGGKVAFDSNYRPALWKNKFETKRAYNNIFQRTDIALVTLEDETALWGDTSPHDTAMRLHQLGVTQVVVRDGSKGCYVSQSPFPAQENIDLFHVPTRPVAHVVDTTSAGDSFNGAFLAAYLSGKPLITCCEYANELAGKVIQHKGAIMPLEHHNAC